jgi:hypothetical protein
MIQNFIAIIIGMAALIYVVKKIMGQFTKTETDPKCDNCPVPDLKKSNNNLTNIKK